MMAKDREMISPRMRAHVQSLADRHGTEEGERPSPPKRPTKLRKPMGHAMNGTVFVDGQAVGPTPTSWSEPKEPPLKVCSSTPLSEAEEIAARKARKRAEREMIEARSEARAKARAAATPPKRPLSEATRNHLLRQLARPDPELLEG
jgi:hypothetical protein